jgi:signal transduction histidine kinase
MLAELQAEAGSELGAKLALPQLAAVARLVRKLGISVSRPAIVAARDHDIEMWVRAEPDGEYVVLTVEQWKNRSPAPARLEVAASDDELIGNAIRNSWAADAELRFTSLSTDLAQLLGVDAAEAVGQPLTRHLRLEEGEDGAMPLLTALAARAAFSGQPAVTRGNGTQRLMLSGDPIRSEDGSFAGFRGRALPDHVLVPKAANEPGGNASIDPALDQALRSPLARIIEAAEGIVDRADGPLRSDYAAYAGDIATAARHLLSVIRSMVEQPADPSAVVDLAALAGDALALVQPQADEQKVALALRGEASIPIHGDRRGVIQILVNLLGNAVRHSLEGGTVTLELRKTGAMGEASIADQGKGIAPADQDRIFEKFERIGDGGGGAGLGLAIARRLARTMGGEIALVSALGEGATFTLSLPLASA